MLDILHLMLSVLREPLQSLTESWKSLITK